MHKTYKRILVTISLALIGLVLAVQCSKSEPIKVNVKSVERGIVESTVANTRAGTIEACRRAGLSTAMGGQITQLSVKKGDLVPAGELLLMLWNDDLQAQVVLAEEQARAARAQAESACIQSDIAQREAQRLQKLKISGAASEEQIDQAVSRAKSSRANCTSAQATVRVNVAQMDLAGANLARTLLIAPFDGVVAEINGELNEYVTPSPPGIATLPAIDLIDNSCFYVTAPIDEVDAPAVAVGMPARISMDAFGSKRFTGRVKRIADYVLDREKQARTLDIEVEFSDLAQQPKLLAGYSADAEIIISAHQDTLRIPTIAVMDGPQVMIYDAAEETLQLRSIKTGISNWDYTEVIDGLHEGEILVTSLDRPGVEEGAYAIVDNDQP